MGVMVICQGCGQTFPTGEGYRRNKIQCPHCGVICPVPESSSRAEKTDPARPESQSAGRRADSPPMLAREEDEALDWLMAGEKKASSKDPERSHPDSAVRSAPGSGRGQETAKRRANSPFDGPSEVPYRATPRSEVVFNCRRCGQKVRRQGECPDCNRTPPPVITDLEVDEGGPTKTSLPPRRLELDEKPSYRPPPQEEEDETPYVLAPGEEPQLCPECNKPMTEGGVLCLACGFDQRQRKKVVKTYEPLARSWDTNLALANRLAIFATCQFFVLVMGLIGVVVGGAPLGSFVGSWVVQAGLLSFLLGTFQRVEITRDGRGRVVVTQTWRYCFIPTSPRVTPVRNFGSVSSGIWHEPGFWEWLIFLLLLLPGIVPALIWWYFVIRQFGYFVALTRDHGYATVYVYRGRSEKQRSDIASTLSQAAELPLDT